MIKRTWPIIRRFCVRSKLQKASQVTPERVGEGLKQLEAGKPHLDKLYYFDPDVMGSLPFFLEWLDLPVEVYKDLLLKLQAVSGLDWVPYLFAVTAGVRLAMLPIMVYQMRKMSSLAPVLPVILMLGRSLKHSSLPFTRRTWLFAKGTLQVLHQNRIQLYRTFLYNQLYLVFMVLSILSMRRLVSEEQVRDVQFLWLEGMANVDPYWVTSLGAVLAIYYNLGRNINVHNRDNLISRLKGVGQVLVILWLPFVCYWPAGVTIFIFFSSWISVLQTTFLGSAAFRKLALTQRHLAYLSFLFNYQLDSTMKKAFVDSILSADERYLQAKEGPLLERTKKYCEALNTEQFDEQDLKK